MDSFAHVSSAAHSGAFGLNNLPEPSLASVRAGTYRKGRVTLHGLKVAIETPHGTRRTGKGDGKPWSVICMAHYGYIEGTKGADGDELDVFIGPWPESEKVWIVNRAKGDDSGFDEHKILMGFPDAESAVTAYRNSYEKGQAGDQSGLGTVPCTIDQLKWWIKFGNHSAPLTANQLPYDGNETMNDVIWDSAASPVGMTVGTLLYAMRRVDSDDHLLLDAVTVADVIEDSDGEEVLDGMVIPLNRMERKLGQMQVIMRAAGKGVKPVAMQITPPFKQRGTTNVAAIFELSDGQTITIYFHNPDSTPNKLTPDDEMVSWKWMLNKKDVTIVVAREAGREINPREVARRVMRLADANSARFARANERRAERMTAIETGKAVVQSKQQQLDELNAEIERLEPLVAAKRAAPTATHQKDDHEGGASGSGDVSADGTESPTVYSDQHSLLEALIGLGWKNVGQLSVRVTGGPKELYWVTKTIGGGVAGHVNPEGDRRLAAKLVDGEMQATHGDKALVTVPFNAALSFPDNAKRLDDAVNAIDPRQAKVVPEAKNKPDWQSVDPTTEGGYALVKAAGEQALLWHQDQLDHFFGSRLVSIRNALRERGWDDDGSKSMKSGPLTKGGYTLEPVFKTIGAGRNIVGIDYKIIGVPGFFMSDTLAHDAGGMAERIDLGLPKSEAGGRVMTFPSGVTISVPLASFTGTKVTKTDHNGKPTEFQTEDGRFTESLSHGFVRDNAVERLVSNMAYLSNEGIGGVPVPDDVRDALRLFYAANKELVSKWQPAQQAGPEMIRNPKFAGLSDADIARLEKEYDDKHNEGGEGFNPYRDHLYVPKDSQDDTDDELITHLVKLIREAKGGVSKLATSAHFTFEFDGYDLIFGDEIRAEVEAAMGEKVKEVVLPGLEGQVSVVPESFGAADPRINAIRAAFGAESRRIGERYPLIVAGKPMFVWQERAGANAGPGVLYVENMKMGRLVAGMEPTVVRELFRLTGKDQLKDEGLPRAAIGDEIARWIGAFPEVTKDWNVSADDPDIAQWMPKPSTDIGNLSSALAFLQTVIDGSADMASAELSDELVAVHEKFSNNAEFNALFAKAADAYAAYMISQAEGVK